MFARGLDVLCIAALRTFFLVPLRVSILFDFRQAGGHMGPPLPQAGWKFINRSNTFTDRFLLSATIPNYIRSHPAFMHLI